MTWLFLPIVLRSRDYTVEKPKSRDNIIRPTRFLQARNFDKIKSSYTESSNSELFEIAGIGAGDEKKKNRSLQCTLAGYGRLKSKTPSKISHNFYQKRWWEKKNKLSVTYLLFFIFMSVRECTFRW